jgi:SAM-dependent methyltransferase
VLSEPRPIWGNLIPEFLADLKEADFETIPCPLCGSWDLEPIYEGVGLRGNHVHCVICRRCTHIHINPRPTLEAFKRFYQGVDYFELCAEFSRMSIEEKLAQFEDDSFWERRSVHGERLYARYLTGRLGPEDTVFDFGCGDGAWLWSLQQSSGCQVDGEEISDHYVEVVKRKLGVDIFNGPIEEVAEDIVAKHEGGVRLAIVSGSLQHMLDPLLCLRAAHQILAEDGFLFVCNWSIFEHYLSPYGDEPSRLIGESLSWEHPHYFHEASFRFMLEQSGFELVDLQIESPIRERHMHAFAKKARPRDDIEPIHDVDGVVARVRSLESATVTNRLRRI